VAHDIALPDTPREGFQWVGEEKRENSLNVFIMIFRSITVFNKDEPKKV